MSHPVAASSLLGIALLLSTPLVAGEQEMHDVVTTVSPDRMRADIQTLVAFGTRHTLSDTRSGTRGIGAARRWIEAEFNRISEACGRCLEVFTVSDIVSGTTRIPEPTEVVNVVAIQRGSQEPNRIVMMTGDIDSRVSDVMDFESDSPGANDNASGMAGVLEAARVLSRHRFRAPLPTSLYQGRSRASRAVPSSRGTPATTAGTWTRS